MVSTKDTLKTRRHRKDKNKRTEKIGKYEAKRKLEHQSLKNDKIKLKTKKSQTMVSRTLR